MQDIILDALKYREAKAGVATPPSKPIPHVAKPGVPRSSADRSAAQIGELHQRFKQATGQRQLELGVQLMKAQRAARGR
jgi:hypothetical protein